MDKKNGSKHSGGEKVKETTASLKNLSLGGSPAVLPKPGQKQVASTNNNTNTNTNTNTNIKNGKKPKKSTHHGGGGASSQNAAVAAAPKKNSGPVLLGMPDSPMQSADDTDPYVTKIGGVPLWLDQDLPAPAKYGICGACGKSMYLLLQAYVPLEKSPYDRVVYVWACNQRLCMRKAGSFRVIRALQLNPEYAQKLEKKSKPATAGPTASALNPVVGASGINPFAAPGAFDMGNALFGGSGSGFANPFASANSTSTNPFAPPSGFGVGSPVPAPAVKSFASVTSANVTEKQDSSSESEDEDAAKESTDWPEKLSSFDPHYLYITEEVLEDSDAAKDDISQRYSHLLALEESANKDDDDENDSSNKNGGATWSGETYEKAVLPKGVDKAFQKFTERVQSWPDQCVRYDFPGTPLLFSYSDRTAQTLLPPNATQHSKHTNPSTHRIPRCPACKGPRGFEFQLMPNLLALLDVTSKKYLSEEEARSLKERKGAQVFDIGMEWGTILAYSCVQDCFGKKAQREDDDDDDNNRGDAERQRKVRYFEEVVLVQFED